MCGQRNACMTTSPRTRLLLQGRREDRRGGRRREEQGPGVGRAAVPAVAVLMLPHVLPLVLLLLLTVLN